MAVVSVLLMAFRAWAAWLVHRLQSNVTRYMAHDISSVRAAEGLAIDGGENEMHLDRYP